MTLTQLVSDAPSPRACATCCSHRSPIVVRHRAPQAPDTGHRRVSVRRWEGRVRMARVTLV
jgi:hypothetical protein